ncbi:MAG TPA: hypothetical protein PLF01_07920 [Alphaproteobacteria bacterium]|nr:hypothetical protein [Alphaproteobacteria bacterium]
MTSIGSDVRRAEAGFTLLEMAVIVVLGGILLSFLGAALLTFLQENRINTTEYRLAKIEEAMSYYLSANGRYPCAASQTIGPENSVFGREVTSTCNVGSFAGTTRRSGVRIGAVPTRNLNLGDEFAEDAWGKKFKYAVTEILATNQLYRSDAGAITIRDDSDTDVTTSAHYIVVSFGATGEGGYPFGAAANPVIPCPLATLETRNCDDADAIFRATLVNPDNNPADFFDDYVLYKGSSAPIDIPAGAVLPFNSASCPDGWTRYTRGEGKYIVGARATPLQLDQYIVRYATSGPATTTLNLTVGTTGEDSDALIPSYLALTYCERLPL